MHSEQNLPRFSAPHWGHFHAASGLGLPHSTQNLPVFFSRRRFPASGRGGRRRGLRRGLLPHLIEGLGVGAAGLTGHIHPHKGPWPGLRLAFPAAIFMASPCAATRWAAPRRGL